jgi:hypothetical protein
VLHTVYKNYTCCHMIHMYKQTLVPEWPSLIEARYISSSIPQSRQSAKLFLQSSADWDSPTQPLTRRRVCPPPPPPPPRFWGGERHTHMRERGWESPNFDEGTCTVHSSIYIYVLCALHPASTVSSVPKYKNDFAYRSQHILLLRKKLCLPDSSVDLGGEGRLADDGNPQGLCHSFSVNTTRKNLITIFMICPYTELIQPPSSMPCMGSSMQQNSRTGFTLKETPKRLITVTSSLISTDKLGKRVVVKGEEGVIPPTSSLSCSRLQGDIDI